MLSSFKSQALLIYLFIAIISLYVGTLYYFNNYSIKNKDVIKMLSCSFNDFPDIPLITFDDLGNEYIKKIVSILNNYYNDKEVTICNIKYKMFQMNSALRDDWVFDIYLPKFFKTACSESNAICLI